VSIRAAAAGTLAEASFPAAGGVRRNERLRLFVTLVALLLVFGSGFSAVRSTNFGGFDEWLVVSLTSQGIVDIPYANRPLNYAPALPGALGLPSTLTGFLVAHASYLLLGGLTLFVLVRRLEPEGRQLAVLAAAVTLVWAPLDRHRLNPLNDVWYSGAALAVLVALLLLVEWAASGRLWALAAGFALAFVAVRTHEGTLGLLSLGGAGLLVALGDRRRRPLWSALLIWESLMSALAAVAVLPLLESPSYQLSGLGLDLAGSGVLARLLRQLGWELGPLVAPVSDLASWRVAVAVLAAALGFVAIGGPTTLPRKRTTLLAAVGLVAGISGWLPIVFSPSIVTPERMQGFAAPGFGLALGALVTLAASFVRGKGQAVVAVALGCWIVAVGTARTLEAQRNWDRESYYPAQSRLLGELASLAPDLRPGTLVVLLDGQAVFPATFTFRHAVSYVYGGRAEGLVIGGFDFLYPSRFLPDAVEISPWPVVREAWRSPQRRYRHNAIVVVREVEGRLVLVDRWPPELPPTPGAARYHPLERIREAGPHGRPVIPGP
jgi:hypothetical protein